ncbi:hypothetical protein F4774DRAFT_408196 [Daldinia eschscholtzii]|nr:hypothetical protein F4774DRAFT_408196 [Daldinia eschscholtzii]
MAPGVTVDLSLSSKGLAHQVSELWAAGNARNERKCMGPLVLGALVPWCLGSFALLAQFDYQVVERLRDRSRLGGFGKSCVHGCCTETCSKDLRV